MIVYAAIGAMFAFMGGIVYYSTFDFEQLEQSEVELLSVDLVEIDSIDNRITLNIVFGITNYGERTYSDDGKGSITFRNAGTITI